MVVSKIETTYISTYLLIVHICLPTQVVLLRESFLCGKYKADVLQKNSTSASEPLRSPLHPQR